MGPGSQWMLIEPTFTASTMAHWRRNNPAPHTHYLTACEITSQQAVKVDSKSTKPAWTSGCGLHDTARVPGTRTLLRRCNVIGYRTASSQHKWIYFILSVQSTISCINARRSGQSVNVSVRLSWRRARDQFASRGAPSDARANTCAYFSV